MMLTLANSEPVGLLSEPCPRCGSFEFIDSPIHNGRSLRRDCRNCGRTHSFPRWYGRPTEAPRAAGPSAGPPGSVAKPRSTCFFTRDGI
jgi:hypothetical protein